MRGLTAGMFLTFGAGVCTIVAFAQLHGGGRWLAAGVGLLVLAHGEGQTRMHATFARIYEGLANNLAAIGVVAGAVRNLEGGQDALDEEVHRRDLA